VRGRFPENPRFDCSSGAIGGCAIRAIGGCTGRGLGIRDGGEFLRFSGRRGWNLTGWGSIDFAGRNSLNDLWAFHDLRHDEATLLSLLA